MASITVDAQGRITAASSGQAGGNTEYWHGIKNSGSGNISTTGNVANFYMYGASGGPGPGNRDNPGDRRDGGFGAYGYWNSPIVQPGNSVPYSMGSGGNQGSNPHGNFKGAASNAGNATTIDLGAASAGTIGEVQVATDMIADDAVTQAKIGDDAVGADQLANTTVSAASYTVASITVDAQGRITAASSGQAGGNTEYWHGIKNSGSGNISTTGNVANFYMYGASGGPGPGNRDNPGDRRDGGFGAYGYWNSPIVQPGNSVPYSMGSGGNQGSNPHGNFKGAASNAGNATTIDLGPGTITINGGNGGNAPPNWNTSGTAGTSGNFSGTSPDQQAWSPATYLIGDSNNQSPSQPGRLLFFANDGDA